MAIVILHRAALSGAAYHEWLADSNEPLFLITSQEKLNAFSERIEDLPKNAYEKVVSIEDYDCNGQVELIVLEIARTHKIKAIVAQAEFDVERAARLREFLGISGQTIESARVFRNKVIMKETARNGGIKVADWAVIEHSISLFDFVKEKGFPVVVKPQNGAGSYGISVLRDQTELNRFIDYGFTLPLDIRPNLMVETFVEGRTYHVDGFVLDGVLVMNTPSIYITESLEFLADNGEATASHLLSSDNPLTDRLQHFISSVLAVLPTPKTTTFHAEVFVTPDEHLVLCEIASRTGGARINDSLNTAFDINISENWARAECSLPVRFELPEKGTLLLPKRLSGWAIVAPKPGKVKKLPEKCEIENVVDFTMNIKIGDLLSAPVAATQGIASFVFIAKNEVDAGNLVMGCRTWFYENTSIIDYDYDNTKF